MINDDYDLELPLIEYDICDIEELLNTQSDQDDYLDSSDPYIYYENLLKLKDSENIKFECQNEEKIVIRDTKIMKKIAITESSIGNIDELIRINKGNRQLYQVKVLVGSWHSAAPFPI